MTRFLRLELDLEEVDGPYVTAARVEERSWHCEGCRTTWFDAVPGPLRVDVDAPEDGWAVFGVGVLPAESPILIVAPAVVEGLRARGIDSFAAHPVLVERVDGQEIEAPSADGGPLAGPPWLALWPSGRAGRVVDDQGEDLAVCAACGRLPGELAEPWRGRLTGEGHEGAIVIVPGWRHSTFVTEAAWSAITELGVSFLRAVPAS